MKWNADPQVLSPVGRPIEEQLALRARRQKLAGFESIYSDIVDYIIRCTHRIWEEKNVGLCRTHYAADCTMHTLAGPAVGAEVVVQGTVGTLASYSDRAVVGEDVIWSEDEPGLYLSSHRITSDGTHLGDDTFLGDATLRFSGVRTIADCHVRANRIVEEWLVRDNLRAVMQVGRDPWQVARRQAATDREGDPARHAWRASWIAAVRKAKPRQPPKGHPAASPAKALALAFNEDLYGDAAQLMSPGVEVRWPSVRDGFGRGYWIGCTQQVRAVLHDAKLRIDHWAARPLPHDDIAVAIRWSLVGRHAGHGVWGAPTGRDVLIIAVSHYRLRQGVIVEDITVFDELAVLRQIAGGLGDGGGAP